jgi:C1A family cysteine protease
VKKTRGYILVSTCIMAVTLLFWGAGLAGAEAQAPPAAIAPFNPAFLEVAQGTPVGPFTAAPSLSPSAGKGPGGRGLGHLPLSMDLSHLKRLPVQHTGKALLAVTYLPAAWDWRTSPGYNAVTPVKDQGACGSCWAFGNMGAIESLYKRTTPGHPNVDLSENNMASCHWPWVWSRCAGGNTSVAAAYLLNLVLPSPLAYQLAGAVLESQDPYSPTSHDSNLCTDMGRPEPYLRVHNFRWIAKNTAAMKKAIRLYGPMVTAFYWTNSRYNSYTGIYYYPWCPYYANHEVLIVGWNDYKYHPGGRGCWIVKNSWGAGWGKGGYFFIPYGTGNVGEDNLSYVSFTPYNANENLYMEDKPGMVNSAGWGATSASGAVVFQPPHQQETLKAVEFFTAANNAQYTIKVWGAVSQSGASATFSDLLQTLSGTCQEMGYYSIPLETPLALTGGQNYAIQVDFSTPGYYYPLPVAHAYPGVIDSGWLGNGTGLTYGRGSSGSTFYRIVFSDGVGAAACIRARTSY